VIFAEDGQLAVTGRLSSCPPALPRKTSSASTTGTVGFKNGTIVEVRGRKRPRQIHVALDERIGEEQEYSVLERFADGGTILKMSAKILN
jgi:hypothetical protein